jgi:hypothetical protein
MALTGTLLADFSAFTNEAAKATTAVQQMETGADTAAAKLSKLGEGVNIKDTISDPMGTATTVATQYAESLGSLGVAAVGLTTTVAALGAALVGLAEHSASTIAEFDNLADKTGMSVPALSRLSNAAAVVGADFNALTNVTATLERNIGTNTATFQKGLAAMGLSTEALRAVGPDRYLETITEGLASIQDPAAKAAAGAEVLGRGYRNVAASLNDLKDGYDKTKDIDPFTAEQAANAERFMNQLGSIKVHLESLAIAFGAPLITPMSTFLDLLGKLYDLGSKAPEPLKALASPGNLLAAAFNTAGAAIDYFIGAAEKLPGTTAPAARGIDALKEAAKELLIYVPTLKDATAATHEVDAAQGAWEKSLRAVGDAMAGWQTILATIPADVATLATNALAAGASQHDVATAFHLSAEQVKALTIAMEDNSKAMTINADFAIDAAKRRTEIEKAMTAAINDQIVAQLKASQAEQEFYMGTVTAAKAVDTANQQIQGSIKTTTDTTQAGLDATLKHAQDLFSSTLEMANAARDFSGATQKKLDDDVTASSVAFYNANLAVKGSADDTGAAVGDAYTQGFGRAQAASSNFRNSAVADAAAVAAATATWETVQGRLDAFGAAQAANPSNIRSIVGEFGGMPYVQTRDSGGPVVAGQSYLIGGGKAPEIFTPGASGFVTPGAAAGGSHVTNIYITQPLGTADAIARAVADAQVNLMRGQGVRLPYGT